MTENKTPLQDEKKSVVDEIKSDDTDNQEETRGVKPGTKRGPYKKKKAAPKKPQPKKQPEPEPEPEYSPAAAANDAKFVTAFINQMRTQIGIPPIDGFLANFFEQSTTAMFLKYGASAGRWMPELMFTGSTVMILLDTKRHISIKRDQVEADSKKGGVKEKRPGDPGGPGGNADKPKPVFDSDGKMKPTLDVMTMNEGMS